jgi:hypothetical protein
MLLPIHCSAALRRCLCSSDLEAPNFSSRIEPARNFALEFFSLMTQSEVPLAAIYFEDSLRESAPKKLQRSFPQFKKFCATMPILFQLTDFFLTPA